MISPSARGRPFIEAWRRIRRGRTWGSRRPLAGGPSSRQPHLVGVALALDDPRRPLAGGPSSRLRRKVDPQHVIAARRPLAGGPSSRPAQASLGRRADLLRRPLAGGPSSRRRLGGRGRGLAGARRPLAGGPSSRHVLLAVERRAAGAPLAVRSRAALHRGSANVLHWAHVRTDSPSARGRPFIEAKRFARSDLAVPTLAVRSRAALHRGPSGSSPTRSRNSLARRPLAGGPSSRRTGSHRADRDGLAHRPLAGGPSSRRRTVAGLDHVRRPLAVRSRAALHRGPAKDLLRAARLPSPSARGRPFIEAGSPLLGTTPARPSPSARQAALHRGDDTLTTPVADQGARRPLAGRPFIEASSNPKPRARRTPLAVRSRAALHRGWMTPTAAQVAVCSPSARGRPFIEAACPARTPRRPGTSPSARRRPFIEAGLRCGCRAGRWLAVRSRAALQPRAGTPCPAPMPLRSA